eukprot:3027548-Amphidinium_carterae.1
MMTFNPARRHFTGLVFFVILWMLKAQTRCDAAVLGRRQHELFAHVTSNEVTLLSSALLCSGDVQTTFGSWFVCSSNLPIEEVTYPGDCCSNKQQNNLERLHQSFQNMLSLPNKNSTITSTTPNLLKPAEVN